MQKYQGLLIRVKDIPTVYRTSFIAVHLSALKRDFTLSSVFEERYDP